MSVLEFIRKQLRRYKDLLANLSRRNRELYFREAKGSTLNLSKKPPVDSEYQEILEEKFVPLRINSSTLNEALNNGSFDLSDHFLLKDINNPELHKRLDKIRLADDKFQREFGISGAWFLGPFLLWRDRSDFKLEELLITPIFKLPINLKKDKKKHWKLEVENNQLQVNPSLRLALKARWGIDLPEEIPGDSLPSALDNFQSILSETGKNILRLGPEFTSVPKVPPRFKIIKDENGEILERQPINLQEILSTDELNIYRQTTYQQFLMIDAFYIDHLNASRTVLINDYDTILDSKDLHPILSELFLGKPIPGESKQNREKIRELDSYKEKENYFVVNIDSTQHRAIDKVTNSRTVVIQGPPGTGKSQTITNLIADHLAKGKRVLFVSEKRPALDVVYSRLQQANLAKQAVLIHSSDLNKQDLYRSFLELSNSVHENSTDKQWDHTTADLDAIKSEINAYYDFLSQEHNPSELAVSDLLTIASSSQNTQFNTHIYAALKSLTYKDLNTAGDLLDEIQRLVNQVPNYASHPWLNRKAGTIYSNSFFHELKELFMNLLSSERVLLDISSKIAKITGSSDVDTLPTVDEIQHYVEREIDDKLLPLAKSFFQDSSNYSRFEQILLPHLTLISEKQTLYTQIAHNADPDLIRQLELYYALNRGFFDWFTPSFWRMRRLRKTFCISWNGTNQSFKAFREIRESLSLLQTVITQHFLPIPISTDNPDKAILALKDLLSKLQAISDLGSFLRKIGHKYFQQLLDDKQLTFPLIKNSLNTIRDLKISASQQQVQIDPFYDRLEGYFRVPPTINRYKKNNDLYDLLYQTATDLDALDRVSLSIEKLCRTVPDIGTNELLNHLLPFTKPWSSICRSIVISGWVDDLRRNFPTIRSFESKEFSEKIKKFQTLESSHREAAREIVNNTLFRRWNEGAGEHEGLGLLTKESNKQRRVLSPREIMEKGAFSAMMKLKPCWLMSPLSISQMLPLQPGLFDVIIFDEASQVRVEDAIPSIYRSKAMVVVGDPKQMPPTNFFSGSRIVDDDEEEEEVEFAPSILDLAAQVYPSEMLEWHYRSRSEALIAFSNRAFYGGRLIAVPSPHLITEGDAFFFHQVSDGYFNQKDGNSKEAESVVTTAYEILKSHQTKSLGIIAMGQSQMIAIEIVIERRSQIDSEFRDTIETARNFKNGDADAGFFVKNLENVQGDERDIILISVGYAPFNKDKKLRLGFGPLSAPGGGRRLNVAITRAKEQVQIFCSFDPNEIPTDELAFSKNPDTVFFGRYLKFVRAISEHKSSEAMSILDSFGVAGVLSTRKGSNFSKDVLRRLTDIGYKVSAEIGSSGFYIDLAVHHPIIPTNFILGIECDGAIFHSTPYARDRDKIRMDLLKSRGWHIERIWSQDWSKDWKKEIARLDIILKSLLGSSIKSSPETPTDRSQHSSHSDLPSISFQHVEPTISPVESVNSKAGTTPTSIGQKYLTKSHFVKGFECATKLYYQTHPEYGNTETENTFLHALAEGGFQVGALAKLYFPGGTEVAETNPSSALEKTNLHLQNDNCILYEAAIAFEGLFARVDILKKVGNTLELIEVKAKSYDPDDSDDQFYNQISLKRGKHEIKSNWIKYLIDIAFQTYVARKAFPNVKVIPYLMMADKKSLATIDNLNQRFLISQDNRGRTKIVVSTGTDLSTVGNQILVQVPVQDQVEVLFKETTFQGGRSFSDLVKYLEGLRIRDEKGDACLNSDCKSCEFRIPEAMKSNGLKSGFEQCWKEGKKLTESDLRKPFIFDIWKLDYRKTEKFINEGVYFMDQLHEEDLAPKTKKNIENESGMSSSQRQWIQVLKAVQKDYSAKIDYDGLASAIKGCSPPYHFIDFETTRVAIPFNSGRHPYEQVAFQFSHHVVHEDGIIEHKDQYINRNRGKFPNFDFIRELKKALSTDDGTIFRYAIHENSVLCDIHDQLQFSNEPDREELCAWITTVTDSKKDHISPWNGTRSMVDLCEWVKSFYYHPLTKGSNSIKKVLPAILQESKFLQTKYSQPIYGDGKRILSLNFRNQVWIKTGSDGMVVDPYRLLEPIFTDLDLDTMDSLIRDNSLADGGAAMTAYARMQFSEMSEIETRRASDALLRYCELDTFAMVMIWEYWQDVLSKQSKEPIPILKAI